MAKRKFSLKRTVILTVVLDILLTAAGLLTFAYFHHVRVEMPTEKRMLATPVPTAVPATPAPTETPAPTAILEQQPEREDSEAEAAPEPTATPVPVDMGILDARFADKFTTGEIIKNENGYRSEKVCIELSNRNFEGSNCIIADIYVKDISSFKTAVFDQFSRHYMSTVDLANSAGAIVALSGDHFYQHRQNGIFAIRNGMVYADNPNKRQDCAVLYSDGTMRCYANNAIDVAAIEAAGPLHVWYFGPNLLDDAGHAIEKFPNSSVGDTNPRSALGYYEPGHYVFVMVEGRHKDSEGLTLAQLARLFEDMGTVCAYNLDGGQSSVITYDGKAISRIHRNGRDISDILYIVEPGQ